MIRRCEPQPTEDDFCPDLQIEATRRLESVLHFPRMPGERLQPLSVGGGHLVVQLLQLSLQRVDLTEGLQHRFQKRAFG